MKYLIAFTIGVLTAIAVMEWFMQTREPWRAAHDGYMWEQYPANMREKWIDGIETMLAEQSQDG